jgi:hypothetical protein
MDRTGMLTKALAAVGTFLVWFPIVVTILASVARSIATGVFRCDYLMPAELFPVAFVGAGLLLWAALRARARRELIGWGFGAMLALLAGGQVLAVVTGLASGETEPAGWAWVLVIVSLAGYTLALVEIGSAGVLLVHDLFQHSKKGGIVLPHA